MRLQFGCVSGDDSGAMGLHYVNGHTGGQRRNGSHASPDRDLRADADGGLKLIGADYLVIADAWNAKHSGSAANSWDSSFTCSKAPIASGFRRSTRCMSGRGRTIPTARS